MMIMLMIVQRMKRIHTQGTAIAPKLEVSKSPRIILQMQVKVSNTEMINYCSTGFEVEILLMASPNAIIVKRSKRRKWRISMTTSVMILIRQPVYWKILRKQRNLSQRNRIIVAVKKASRPELGETPVSSLSKQPMITRGMKISRRIGGMKSKQFHIEIKYEKPSCLSCFSSSHKK